MKKIYGFLGAAALMMMTACSNEDLGEQNVPQNPSVKGDLYMSMTITPTGSSGSTRADEGTTQTPNQGSEVGQTTENVISSAIVAIAKPNEDNTDYIVVAKLSNPEINGSNTSYTATYKTERNTLLTDVSGKDEGVEYTMFVIANPTKAIANAIQEKQTLQQVFTMASDNDTENIIWSENKFLMTNAHLTGATKTIKPEDVALGKHTTPAEALQLGSVTVQRAMSRFDIATTYKNATFTVVAEDDAKSRIKGVSVQFEAATLVNMAKKANLFKVTDSNNKKINFADETKTNWVYTPDQEYSYIYPAFSDLEGTEEGSLDGAAKRLDSPDFTYTLFKDMNGDRNTFNPPSDATTGSYPTTYKFWRYCMENTNPDQPSNQKNGNSTGIIFRAKISATGLPEEALKLYTYGNVVFGAATDLRDYVYAGGEHTTDADVFATVSNRYQDAVEEYNKTQSDGNKFVVKSGEEEVTGIDIKTATETQLEALIGALVKQKFTIYSRKSADQSFYCYYYYWNRHNNNYDNTQMGPMEFATVRNNVYKIYVEDVFRLGHPVDPEEDPNTPDPDDPDEDDEFYCTIECKILDWEVRLNGLVF